MFGVASLTGNSFEIQMLSGVRDKKKVKKENKKEPKDNNNNKGNKGKREKKRLMILHTSQVSSVVRSSD